jgi:hypothetical protein
LSFNIKQLVKAVFYYFEAKLTALKFFYAPWPWYVAGVIIGLMVPALLIAGNKLLGVRQRFGISVPLAFQRIFLSLLITGGRKAGICFLHSVLLSVALLVDDYLLIQSRKGLLRQQSHHCRKTAYHSQLVFCRSPYSRGPTFSPRKDF